MKRIFVLFFIFSSLDFHVNCVKSAFIQYKPRKNENLYTASAFCFFFGFLIKTRSKKLLKASKYIKKEERDIKIMERMQMCPQQSIFYSF